MVIPGILKGEDITAARCIIRPKPRRHAWVTLFCIPHAGAGASVFRSWPDGLPEWMELALIQLPGRESRVGEAFPQDVHEVTDALLEEMDGLLRRPYALFGQSMGALIAFELARQARGVGRPQPLHLFVAAYGAPHRYSLRPGLDELSTSQLTETLRRWQGTPEALLRNAELMAFYIRILRADLALCAGYRYHDDRRLDIGISAFAGMDDPDVGSQALAAWRELTTSTFRMRRLPGRHLFPPAVVPELLRAIESDLSDTLSSSMVEAAAL
jgi:medium-chain acyl-[acyl-carrier-protein] hydrolase